MSARGELRPTAAGERSAPRLTPDRVVGSFAFTLSWRVEALRLDQDDFKVTSEQHHFALAGSWILHVVRVQGGDLEIKVLHTFPSKVFKDAEAVLSMSWVTPDDDHGGNVMAEVVKPKPVRANRPGSERSGQLHINGGYFVQYQMDDCYSYTPHDYRVHFSIKHKLPGPPQEAFFLAMDMPAPMRTAALPHDVRFVFPNAKGGTAELWANRELLKNRSEYYKTLFESSFSETIPVGSKRPRLEAAEVSSAHPAPAADAAAVGFDDSDDETDELLFRRTPPILHDLETLPIPHREIAITTTAYSTFSAVLVYLQTGYIRFAPLTSSCRPALPSAEVTRLESIERTVNVFPPHPFPVSPKSAFRLANLLELDPLEQYCLQAATSSFTHAGAAAELFSKTSQCFDSWRGNVVEYVVEHWEDVEKTDNWRETAAKAKAGEMPHAAGILMQLAEGLAARAGAERGFPF
ncbi:hypothetical protein JCM10450v2_004943 [Rhodotorula kratochvilovae]